MSKNIFSVLAHEDSDEDKPKQQKVQQPVQKLPKKEAQEQDRQLREKFGDQVQKDAVSHKRLDNPPKNKGDYASGEKRPFERHSGTGRPAFNNDFKKSGYGRGNVGTNPTDAEAKPEQKDKEEKEGEEQGGEAKAPKVAEEPEQIIAADEFIKKAGLNYNFLQQEQQVTNTKPPTVTDPNLKVMSHKTKDEPQHNRKAKNLDSLMQGSKNLADEQAQTGQKAYSKRKPSPQQKKRIDYNEENFPALS